MVADFEKNPDSTTDPITRESIPDIGACKGRVGDDKPLDATDSFSVSRLPRSNDNRKRTNPLIWATKCRPRNYSIKYMDL